MARQAKDARPNAAHDALVAIERAVERFVLLTQNVDGLHEEAGSRNVIAIHGTLAKSRCMDCGTKGTFTRAEFAALTEAPRCYTCGGYLRPEVVLFGEMLPLAETARLHREFAVEIPDLVLSVGTSALFPYIQQPARIAREAGKLTVEINPERTEISALVDYSLQGRAGELLPLVADVFG
jgi:NAD-dependent deacetylase